MGAGVIGTNVLQVLRILTPNEVQRMTNTELSTSRVSLTELLTEEHAHTDSRAKSNNQYKGELRLVKGSVDEEDLAANENDNLKSEATNVKDSDDNLNHVAKQEKKDFQYYEKHADEILREAGVDDESISLDDNESTSVFLLQQKEKSKKSQFNLKRFEIQSLYKKLNSVDVKSEVSKDGDLKQSSVKGLLVNKRQY